MTRRDLAREGIAPFLAAWSGIVLVVLVGTWTTLQTPITSIGDYLARWDRWDAVLLRRVAEFGYTGDPALPPDPGLPSFFPGFPLVLRGVHLVVPDWVLAGLLVSLVSGGVAAHALTRLAELEGLGSDVGRRAVLLLFAAPYAVFLVAGYSEALFLALALPAWVAGRQDRWAAAGLLAGAASLVRVTGLFLGAGLLVMYLIAHGRPRREALPLALPFAAVGGYVVYLHALTGDWLAWPRSQEEGFGRRLTWPWEALRSTWGGMVSPDQGAEYRFAFGAEIVAVAVGIGLLVVLVRRRTWPEAVYVGLSVAALVSSTFFFSVTRASLLWWSLPLLLAAAGARRPWVVTAFLVLSLPLLAGLALTFTSGHWVA